MLMLWMNDIIYVMILNEYNKLQSMLVINIRNVDSSSCDTCDECVWKFGRVLMFSLYTHCSFVFHKHIIGWDDLSIDTNINSLLLLLLCLIKFNEDTDVLWYLINVFIFDCKLYTIIIPDEFTATLKENKYLYNIMYILGNERYPECADSDIIVRKVVNAYE
jgi:hypothetical protein